MKRYDLLVEQCDSDIRNARPSEVAKRLRPLNLARVPRLWRLPLAKICRRAGLYSTGLLLLSRLIHDQTDPTPQELAEYGALLLRSGAVSEAETYLNRADSTIAPDALLYQAYAHFIRWEFSEAIAPLQNYLKADLTPYARLVAETNLAYALVETRQHGPALNLLERIIEATASAGYALLERNARCYRAQAYFQEEDFGRARKEVSFVQSQSASGPTNDELVVLKYQLLFEGVESKNLEPINRLRTLAKQNRDSASYREADLYSLKVKFDLERFLHLYFGTPFTAFRKRITQELNFFPDREIYVLGPKSAPRFDLMTGLLDGKLVLNPGHECHQMIDVLLRDFYQPLRVPALFSMLFVGEHFDPNSSPDRVHQVIRRTRRWLESARIPVQVREEEGFYSLDMTGKFSFRVPLVREPIDPMALRFRSVQETFSMAGSFSARDVRDKLKLPKTSVFRLLKWAVNEGKVTRLEAGSSVVYQIAS